MYFLLLSLLISLKTSYPMITDLLWPEYEMKLSPCERQDCLSLRLRHRLKIIAKMQQTSYLRCLQWTSTDFKKGQQQREMSEQAHRFISLPSKLNNDQSANKTGTGIDSNSKRLGSDPINTPLIWRFYVQILPLSLSPVCCSLPRLLLEPFYLPFLPFWGCCQIMP